MLDQNSVASKQANPDLFRILKGVSRSFYLSICILPQKVRWPVALAYLLARAADTLADAQVMNLQDRITALRVFRRALENPNIIDAQIVNDWVVCFEKHPHTQERFLIQNVHLCLADYASLPSNTRGPTQKVLTTLSQGMLNDLEFFTPGSLEPSQFSQESDTDHYTYLVAGCVGEFWTEVLANEYAFQDDIETVKKHGINFGKGLQWVNILRDIPGDFRNQRIYLSQELFSRFNLSKNDLKLAIEKQPLPKATTQNLKNLMRHSFSLARPLLFAGLSYTQALPWHAVRLRLAVIWPLWIGLKTFHLLENANDFPSSPKISRSAVYRLMFLSLFFCMHSGLLAWYTSRLYESPRTNVA